MICYLNRGLILEQAIVAIIREYFESLHFSNKYSNFNLKVTTEHPFAKLYLEDGKNSSDSFPCVVVSTQEDRKPQDLMNLAPNVYTGIGINEKDLQEITKTEENYINKKGVSKTRVIPGLCSVVDDSILAKIKETIKRQEYCYGYSIRTRRKDSVGIEIWAENIQLKNEIYEQLRLFVTSNLRFILSNRYPFFDVALFDDSIIGHRSNNYNFDFDVVLSGAHISFEINYCVEQIVLNTDLTEISQEVITEVINHG